MCPKWVPQRRSHVCPVRRRKGKRGSPATFLVKRRNIIDRSFVKKKKMETQHSWRLRLSFKNATIVMTVLNIITVFFLLKGFISSPSTRNNKPSTDRLNSVALSYIKESEEMRLALQPWKLIKRIKEIEQEAHAEPETVQHKDTKQTAAADLSKRLQDIRALNDASSLKALEEWRKRKMERARQRALEKNGTGTSQA